MKPGEAIIGMEVFLSEQGECSDRIKIYRGIVVGVKSQKFPGKIPVDRVTIELANGKRKTAWSWSLNSIVEK